MSSLSRASPTCRNGTPRRSHARPGHQHAAAECGPQKGYDCTDASSQADSPSSPCLPSCGREGAGLGVYEAASSSRAVAGGRAEERGRGPHIGRGLQDSGWASSCRLPRAHAGEGRAGLATTHPSSPCPSTVPNRSTFTCPYCGARNLDQQELVKHCVDNHRSDPNRVVSNCRRPAHSALLGPQGGGLLPTVARLHHSFPCSRCAPSARRCPGVTPATRAPTSYSTCSTGTSSPTIPLWCVSYPTRTPRPVTSLRPTAQRGVDTQKPPWVSVEAACGSGADGRQVCVAPRGPSGALVVCGAVYKDPLVLWGSPESSLHMVGASLGKVATDMAAVTRVLSPRPCWDRELRGG